MSRRIAEAATEADRAACLALRIEVFCGEQDVTRDEEIDGLDAAARHLLATVDGTPAGTLRLRFMGKAAKIERVCVARAHRGTGLGAALMREGLRVAADAGATEAWLGAQVAVIPFYERLGFAAQGPEYLDARIPHRNMTRPLP
ncbi:MAG: GNAT family N-acetyltransferase [Paracoccaceae bacterium]|jgi:ElaA protein|nr:GNAT family N-acetyltransferase [Paracoccaceae bacterium]